MTAVLLEKRGDSAVVTFNRPEIRSPLSVFVLEDLTSIADELLADTAVKRVVFTGRDGVFASGADLREIAALDPVEAREFALRGQTLMDKIARLRSVAAIDGVCFGGALDLALACRIRIASARSVFCHPGANLGIVTGWGGTQRLPRLVGRASALEMFLLARRVAAADALRIGLIDRISELPVEDALVALI